MGLSSSFFQSLGIIVREGFEVVLLLGAMLAFVRKAGEADQARALWWGAAAAGLLSIATALAVQALFHSAQHVELLEGVTMLVAAAVLYVVGHWLLAKADVARWRAYIATRLRRAAGRRSRIALAAVAFVAVYREGVETVLFYRALLSDPAGSGSGVLLGFVVGCAVLAAACYGIYRFGVRVPLRPFFAVTSALLLLLCVVFTGNGLHELQEAGALGETEVSLPALPALGFHPTVETLVGQALVLLAIFTPLVVRSLRGSRAVPSATTTPLQDPPGEASALPRLS